MFEGIFLIWTAAKHFSLTIRISCLQLTNRVFWLVFNSTNFFFISSQIARNSDFTLNRCTWPWCYFFMDFSAISQKINTTTSRDWNEGHIFRDRRILQMFVSYCSASPICFKIGRITFTSTLAWFSVFFGGTGLLFHFF